MRLKNMWMHALPALLLVLVQIGNGWGNVLTKVVVNDGLSLRVFVAYRYLFATAFVAPLALVFERNTRRKMTWTVLFQAILCGLFGGALTQNLQMEALALTSVTFATAVSNLVPAFTSCPYVSGKAKIIGTITGIGGAMVLIFVKGVEIHMLSFHVNLFHHQNSHVVHPHASSGGMFIWGALSSFASNVSYALWLIIQARMSERYPTPYSSTALLSLMGTLLSFAFAFCLERDLSQWRLGWNLRLMTVAYTGIVISGVMVAAISWCVRMRGPLFVSVFTPLMLVVAAFAGSVILDEKLYLGSIIGSVLIVCGLYMVLWGKHKEMIKNQSVTPNSPHESDTIDYAANMVKDNEDSSENGHEEHVTHIH